MLTTGGDDENSAAQRMPGVTFDDFLSNKYRAKVFNGTWYSPNEIQWRDANGDLVLWNVETYQTKPLVTGIPEGATLMGNAPNDETLMLLREDNEPVWRHSSIARYFVLDSVTNKIFPIVPKDEPEGSKIQYANWMPHPTSNRLAYVYKNDILMRPDARKVDEDVVVSADGIVDEVYNGIPDWVYEEEVLATNVAMYYSELGRYIAYAHFDDRAVETFYYQTFGDPNNLTFHQYPKEIGLKYPKTGTTNPTLQLRIKDMDNPADNFSVLIPPAELEAVDHIYTAANWIGDERLSVIWMNRVQNNSVVTECSVDSRSIWNCVEVSRLQEENGWLDLFQPPKYSKSGNAFLQIRTVPMGLMHYFHVVKVVTSPSTDEKELTGGEVSVTSILGWDETNGIVYYMATGEGEPGARQLYSISDDPDSDEPATCITCHLTMPTSGEPCKYNSISINPDFTRYVQTCLGPNIPEVVERPISAQAEAAYIIEANMELRSSVAEVAIPEIIYQEVEIEGGFKAQVEMHMPPNYDSNIKYPMVVYVYGGPNTQEVDYRWSLGVWGDFLTTNYDIIYTSIDGRGSGYQSAEKLFAMYKKMGTVEIDDQISVTKTLIGQYSFIDAERTGIWGWSYGGYFTLMTLARDSANVFGCGISVAPVTSWLFYDTIYTERYMGLPTAEDNLAGYEEGSAISKVENYRGKSLLVDHGVADDNVHYQQTLMFTEAMQRADVYFQMNSFPDENHGIGGLSRFLYHSHDRFWSECFGHESVIKD